MPRAPEEWHNQAVTAAEMIQTDCHEALYGCPRLLASLTHPKNKQTKKNKNQTQKTPSCFRTKNYSCLIFVLMAA